MKQFFYGACCVVIGLFPLWVALGVQYGLRPLLKWDDARRLRGKRGFEVMVDETKKDSNDGSR